MLWVAYEQKLLKKYGLDVEYIAIENGTVGMQALLANEAQFLFYTSSLAVNANLRGADVTMVAGGLNFIPDKLIVRPEITKPEELIGKRLAISRFGSSSETSAKLTLEKVGVKPESVSLIQLGGVSTRQVALMAGQVQATILSDPQATAATNGGFGCFYSFGGVLFFDPEKYVERQLWPTHYPHPNKTKPAGSAYARSYTNRPKAIASSSMRKP